MRCFFKIAICLCAFTTALAGCDSTEDPASPAYYMDAAAAGPDGGSSAGFDMGVFVPEVQVSVATFNVRKFFDTHCDSRNCGGNSFEVTLTESEFAAKAEQVANGIRALNADVVLLQEIETEACLTAIASFLVNDGYSAAALGETGGSASLDVAVVARGAIIGTRSHKDEAIPLPNRGTTTFSRDLLEVYLTVNTRRVIVFSAHFKAKTSDDPERRLAEAMASREIALAVADNEPNALIVFGGDLNDNPGSTPINALEGNGRMIRVASELGSEAATYTYQGQAQAIDHLYLVETPVGRYMQGTARVVRSNQRGLAGSDHAGLVATFAIGR